MTGEGPQLVLTLQNKNAFQYDAYQLLQWPALDVSYGGSLCPEGGFCPRGRESLSKGAGGLCLEGVSV